MQKNALGTVDVISKLQQALLAAVQQFGVPYVIQVDEFEQVFTNQSHSTITIIPTHIAVGAPLNNQMGNILQSEKQYCDIKLWAINYDGLRALRQFFRQTARSAFKGWVEFDSILNETAKQDQYGRLQTWPITITTDLEEFVVPFGYTKVNTDTGTQDTNPLVTQ
jgi:hypothetical protein